MKKEFTFINVTPHAIVVRVEDLEQVYAPSGTIARVEDTFTLVKEGIYLLEQGEVQDLPLEQEGVFYIVSAMVFAATDRVDVVAPATGLATRNDKGHIISVPGFIFKKEAL